MSLNFGFNVGVRSGHHRHPNTVEAAELLHELRSVVAMFSRRSSSVAGVAPVPSIEKTLCYTLTLK